MLCTTRGCFYVLSLLLLVAHSKQSSQRPSLFIVPSIDGIVSAFDATNGKLLWNLSTGGPLIASPSSSATPSPSEVSIFNIIQRDGLQELYPETNSILNATPFMSSDGTIFLSHKRSKMLGVNPLTGTIISDSISQPNTDSTALVTEDIEQVCVPELHIIRTEHTLESRNGTFTRSLTVAHVRAFLRSCSLKEENGVDINFISLPLLSTTRLGDLQAIDKNGNMLWMFDLPVPHAQVVYALTEDSIRPIRPQSPVEPLKAPLSLTNYKGTPYERPYDITEPRTLALPSHAAKDDTRISIWYWIATISVCITATIWGLIILKHQHRPVKPTTVFVPPPLPVLVPRSESSLRLREEHEQLQQQLKDLLLQQEQQQQKHLLQAQQLQQLQEQQQQQLSQSPEMPITISRYRADFEERGRLGEGGFGTVFLAINKLDGVAYAIKKVCLTPGNTKENARVLREVHYLALLDHPNIIRYFQSWVEEDELNDWDECKIGSRFEEYNDDCDDGGETERQKRAQTESLSSIDSIDDVYEGDESSIGVLEHTLETSDVSGSEKSNSSTTFDFNFKASYSAPPRDVKLNRANLKLMHVLNYSSTADRATDRTYERMYGSTDNTISMTRVNTPPPNSSRQPILYIQMQYCHQGTLHHWLSRADRVVCSNEVIAIFRQAVRGVIHIHSHFVIHRDLKPPNILISADGCVKIGDFGLSTGGMIESGLQSPVRSLSCSHTTGVGSPLYCSPEQLKGERYDSKVDIYSLGVILFEMFHIFSTQMERVNNITQLRDGHISDQTKTLYPQVADLVLKLVQPNPALRPPAKDILLHPLFDSL